MREFMVLHPDLIGNLGLAAIFGLAAVIGVRRGRRRAENEAGKPAPPARTSPLTCLLALGILIAGFFFLTFAGAMVFGGGARIN